MTLVNARDSYDEAALFLHLWRQIYDNYINSLGNGFVQGFYIFPWAITHNNRCTPANMMNPL